MQFADAMCVSYRFGLLIGWPARAYCSCYGSVVDMFGCWLGGRPVHAAAAVGVWLYVCLVVRVADQCIPRLLRGCGLCVWLDGRVADQCNPRMLWDCGQCLCRFWWESNIVWLFCGMDPH